MSPLCPGQHPQSNMLTSAFSYDETTTKRGWLTNLTVSAGATPYLNLSLSFDAKGNVQVARIDNARTYYAGGVLSMASRPGSRVPSACARR